jgi:aminocarboxymuconate-semialdehyde decarboxylase
MQSEDFGTIDFHCHLRPKSFVDTLSQEGILKRSEVNGRIQIIENGTTMGNVPPVYSNGEDDLTHRLSYMTDSNMIMELLSIPRSHDYPMPIAPKLCRIVNDEYSRIVKNDPQDRFRALASIPMNDVQASIAELDRSINDLGLNGVCIGGNLNGRPLDEEAFWPLYEKMNDLETIVFIHPGFPPWRNVGMEKYNLAILLGYEFDTVLAATRLVLGGVLDDFPKIKFVFSHFGGGLPFLVHRVGHALSTPQGRGIKAHGKFKDYLRRMYYDTANNDLETCSYAFNCTYDLVGADHILFGTDYPWHNHDFASRARDLILAQDIPDSDKEKILIGNAKRLLRVN